MFEGTLDFSWSPSFEAINLCFSFLNSKQYWISLSVFILTLDINTNMEHLQSHPLQSIF